MPGSRLIGRNQVLPNSTVVFSCDANADLHGPKKLVCLEDGRFDADYPTCIGKYLFHPMLTNTAIIMIMYK